MFFQCPDVSLVVTVVAVLVVLIVFVAFDNLHTYMTGCVVPSLSPPPHFVCATMKHQTF